MILLSVILMVYILYCFAGLLQQTILTTSYQNSQTHQNKYYQFAIGFVLLPALVSWVLGVLLSTKDKNKTQISMISSFKCGLLIFISSLAFSKSLYYGQYHIFVMLKSYNIVPLTILHVLVTKLNGQYKLKEDKLIFFLLTTMSIVIYMIFQQSGSLSKQHQSISFSLMVISLLADAFVNIFQIQIKNTQKPNGFEMYRQINKWKLVLCLLYLFGKSQARDFIQFLYHNKKCAWHLILFGFASAIGQAMIYWLMIVLRDNLVPFISSTRKMTSVLLSVIRFGHDINLIQILSIVILFFTTIYNFFKQITSQKQQNKEPIKSVLSNMVQGQSFTKLSQGQSQNY